MQKNWRVIAAADVTTIFDAACIASLAMIARLPPGSDLARFGEGVRWAALNYVQMKRQPSPNAVHREIKSLHALAFNRRFEPLAAAVDAMTPVARALLGKREARVRDRMPDWRISAAEELRDLASRAKAAEGLLALLEIGAERSLGRQRPSGRRSITRRSEVFAPPPSRAEPRRAPERELVMWLQIAVAEAGARVPVTARHDAPGPFARMAAECLRLVGAIGPANARGLAVEMIRELRATARTRKKLKKRKVCSVRT